MKIIVTGSLGNISQPLTEILVAQGHCHGRLSFTEPDLNEYLHRIAQNYEGCQKN